MVLLAVRVSGRFRTNSLVSGSSVAFMREISGGTKLRIFGHLGDVMIIQRTFRCDIDCTLVSRHWIWPSVQKYNLH